MTASAPHTRDIVRRAPVPFALKVGGAAMAFALNVVLARTLGADGVGLFLLGVTVLTVGGVVGRVGLDHALLRHVAGRAASRDWPAVAGVVRIGIGWATIASAATALLVVVAAPWLAVGLFGEPGLAGHLRVLALAVVPFALFVLYAQLLKALGHASASLALQGVALPTATIVGVVFLAPTFGVRGAVVAYVIACWLTVALGAVAWRLATPQIRRLRGHFESRDLLASSAPLFWSSLFSLVVLWSPTLMLGVWGTSADVGIFGVANRTAMLLSFVLVAVNSVVAPRYAALHANGDAVALGTTARSAARLAAIAAAPLLLVVLAFPVQILHVFGAEFTSGARMLQVLAVGQYVNVVTGSVGMLLMMCGHERAMRNITAASAGGILVLNGLLIPLAGAMGAAIAFASILVLQNVAATVSVWRRLGIRPLLFGAGRRV